MRAEIKWIFADGGFVIVHAHGVREPRQRCAAIVDISRLEGEKIVEHWDVMPRVPETASNQNVMF